MRLSLDPSCQKVRNEARTTSRVRASLHTNTGTRTLAVPYTVPRVRPHTDPTSESRRRRNAMRRVEVRSRRRLLDDFFKIDEAEISFERFDGSMTPPVRRLVFERGDSAAAVVFERDANRLLLTEQFRFPTLKKGPGWLIE